MKIWSKRRTENVTYQSALQTWRALKRCVTQRWIFCKSFHCADGIIACTFCAFNSIFNTGKSRKRIFNRKRPTESLNGTACERSDLPAWSESAILEYLRESVRNWSSGVCWTKRSFALWNLAKERSIWVSYVTWTWLGLYDSCVLFCYNNCILSILNTYLVKLRLPNAK